MSKKFLIFWGSLIGSILGGYIPSFFGFGMFSYTATFLSAVGAIIGVWLGYKFGE